MTYILYVYIYTMGEFYLEFAFYNPSIFLHVYMCIHVNATLTTILLFMHTYMHMHTLT